MVTPPPSPFYEVISQKIFFFANEGFPYRLTLRTFRGGTSEIKHPVFFSCFNNAQNYCKTLVKNK